MSWVKITVQVIKKDSLCIARCLPGMLLCHESYMGRVLSCWQIQPSQRGRGGRETNRHFVRNLCYRNCGCILTGGYEGERLREMLD